MFDFWKVISSNIINTRNLYMLLCRYACTLAFTRKALVSNCVNGRHKSCKGYIPGEGDQRRTTRWNRVVGVLNLTQSIRPSFNIHTYLIAFLSTVPWIPALVRTPAAWNLSKCSPLGPPGLYSPRLWEVRMVSNVRWTHNADARGIMCP